MKFLIVDDSLAMQTIIKINLGKAGYNGHDFQTAADGKQALKMIEEWHPDVVITDWHMPNMTGIELLLEVQLQGLNVNIGLVTTETDPKLIEDAKSAGALFVLHKPFDIDELKEAMSLVCDDKGNPTTKPSIGNADSSQPNKTLKLPNVAALNKLTKGIFSDDISVEQASAFTINYEYLPYVVVLFCTHDHTSIKAMCVMDVRAVAIITSALEEDPKNYAEEIIRNRMLGDEQLTRIKKMMGMVSVLFHGSASESPLEVKGVHVIDKPSEQLVKLGATSKEKRLVLTIQSKQQGEGQLIFLAVADK
ncbi:response regulator [Pseudomonas sp. HK3]